MKFEVKSLEEIKNIACETYSDVIYLPEDWEGESGDCPGFVFDSMTQYCGKVIDLEDWNGWRGLFGGYTWTLPMLKEIKMHNRNGANR